jgi:hypothetical protein
LQQLVGVQLCPIPQQQWLAAQNGLCIVCNASDVRRSSVLDLAHQSFLPLHTPVRTLNQAAAAAPFLLGIARGHELLL